MKLKDAILEVMDREELKSVVDDLRLEEVDRRSRESMAEALRSSKAAKPHRVLQPLTKDKIQEVCALMGQRVSGSKTDLIQRLLEAHRQRRQQRRLRRETPAHESAASPATADETVPEEAPDDRVAIRPETLEPTSETAAPHPAGASESRELSPPHATPRGAGHGADELQTTEAPTDHDTAPHTTSIAAHSLPRVGPTRDSSPGHLHDWDRESTTLSERAQTQGVFGAGRWLIVAPTATGKSYIAHQVIRHAVESGERQLHLYLVPYRALARQVHEDLAELIAHTAPHARVSLLTGDADDPVDPHSADVVVSTYERGASLLGDESMPVATVVADEFHLLGDPSRGPAVESLVAVVLARQHVHRLLALSAVIESPEPIAQWLGAQLVQGHPSDRSVALEQECVRVDDARAAALDRVPSEAAAERQLLVFCPTRSQAMRLAKDLQQHVAGPPDAEVERLCAELEQREEDPALSQELRDAVASGVAWHHAGLSRHERRLVEHAFLAKQLRVITCTPTLAAGINLPCDVAIVTSVRRPSDEPGHPRWTFIGRSQILNMIGRAGRPGYSDSGRGVVWVDTEEVDAVELRDALRQGRGEPLSSQLPRNVDGLLRALLSFLVLEDGADTPDLIDYFKHTLWFQQDSGPFEKIRTLRSDMMEDFERWPQAEKQYLKMDVLDAHPVPRGVQARVRSGDKEPYTVELKVDGVRCDCWDSRARDRHCKHTARVIHDLLVERLFDTESNNRALYTCLHVFSETLDPSTKIRRSLKLLQDWGLVENHEGEWHPTALGRAAARTVFDMLVIRDTARHVHPLAPQVTTTDVVRWALDVLEGSDDTWTNAVLDWIDEVSRDGMRMPQKKSHGDLERTLDDLGRLCAILEQLAYAIARADLAEAAYRAQWRLRVGIRDDLVELARLRLPDVGRVRLRYLHDQQDIRSLDQLAHTDSRTLAGQSMPLAIAEQVIQAAQYRMGLSQPQREVTRLSDLFA